MSSPLLVAKGIQKAYRVGRSPLRVLTGCDLTVRAGEFVAIMGRSGSGKSTLLQILGALDVPDAGELRFADGSYHASDHAGVRWARRADTVLRMFQLVLLVLLTMLVALGFLAFIVVPLVGLIGRGMITSWPRVIQPHLWASFVTLGALGAALVLLILILLARLLLSHVVERRRIYLRRNDFGFVFQFYHLLPELNVLENAVLPRMVDTPSWGWLLRPRSARREAREILERVGLGQRLHHRPSELSGGERQRVAIARALVHRPKILFADEPTGNLDAAAGAELMTLLKQLHNEGQTIVMVTHDAAIAQQADRILRLENGALRDV